MMNAGNITPGHYVSIDELQDFIRNWRRKHALCPDCATPARRNGTNYKGKQQYECTNHKCKRTSFVEE